MDDIRIGVSTCLLGEKVRYDGGHKRDSFITDVLGRHVRFVPVCPEVDIGMGIPREPVRLVHAGGAIRMRGVNSSVDHTAAMRRYSRRKVRELETLGLSGYILKKGSPSCGMERVRVYSEAGKLRRSGTGLFAAALREALPDLPIEEEGKLNDAGRRENFLERIFAYRRVTALFAGGWRVGDLVRFHAAEKLLLLAHDPTAYRELGRFVTSPRTRTRRELAADYRRTFMQGLRKLATTRKQANVLRHILSFFKECAGRTDLQELQGLIEDYGRGLVPLVVPITFVRHLVRVHDVESLRGQTYLEPHAEGLMPRNHV